MIVLSKVSKNRRYGRNVRNDVNIIGCVMQQDGLYWSDIQTDPPGNVLLGSDVQQF